MKSLLGLSVFAEAMRVLKPLCVFVALATIGCGHSESPAPANHASSSSSVATADASKPTASAEMGKKTEAYWNKCGDVHKQFVRDMADIPYKEFRPKAVGTTCRDAAKGLRGIDNAGVDPEVIDHINRVIRGIEQIGAIAETKGKESLWRDTAAAIGFVIKVARGSCPGIVADGGSLLIGIGASEEGGKATREGQAETIGIANRLAESEEQAIRHVRKTYRIELKPW
jgi:hypothetical protein